MNKYKNLVDLIITISSAERNCGIQLLSDFNDIGLVSFSIKYLNQSFFKIIKKYNFEICNVSPVRTNDSIVVEIQFTNV